MCESSNQVCRTHSVQMESMPRRLFESCSLEEIERPHFAMCNRRWSKPSNRALPPGKKSIWPSASGSRNDNNLRQLSKFSLVLLKGSTPLKEYSYSSNRFAVKFPSPTEPHTDSVHPGFKVCCPHEPRGEQRTWSSSSVLLVIFCQFRG